MISRVGFVIMLVLAPVIAVGQFPPSAGQDGSTAIRNDSSILVAWASHCEVIRGPMDISHPEGGYASHGSPEMATGYAEGNPMNTVSLGDGGQAILTFDGLIYNGPGPDFVVFENSFSDDFLELAFVEVSSDGIHYCRFPSVSLTDTTFQVGTFGTLNPEKIHNLAGKYRAGYGAPFDLEEIIDCENINTNAISHVRIIDVVGSINPAFASRDAFGRIINDPWPTPFSSSGFDLDGVGCIHFSSTGHEISPLFNKIIFLPDSKKIIVSPNIHTIHAVHLYSIGGQLLLNLSQPSHIIDLPALPPGIYLLKLMLDQQNVTHKIALY